MLHKSYSARVFSVMCVVFAGCMLAACDPTEDLNAREGNLAGAQDRDGDGIPDGRPDGRPDGVGPDGRPDGSAGGGRGEHPCDPILRALDQATGEEDILRVLNSYDACLAAHQGGGGHGGPNGGHGGGHGGRPDGSCAPPPEMLAQCEEILRPLHEDPSLPPEIGEQLKQEFEACMQQVRQDSDCPTRNPDGQGCYVIAGDPAACEPIKEALNYATDPHEIEILSQELNRCLERISQEQVVCPPPPHCKELPPGDPAICEDLRAQLEQTQDPQEQEHLRAAFEDCMQQQIGGVICGPQGGCYQVPADPAACEPILEPLKNGEELPPEEAEQLFQAFDECMRSQPTIEICEGEQPPPACYQVPADPAACEPILEPLKNGEEITPEEADQLFQAFDACMRNQPTVEVCDDGSVPPPPPAGHCEEILLPLQEGQELPPEELEALRAAYEQCLADANGQLPPDGALPPSPDGQ